MAWSFKSRNNIKIYAYADTEMKRKAIEAATEQNHPLRKRSIDAEEPSDAEFKKAYGLL